MNYKLHNNQQGSILLYSLIIISLITAISITVSIIVVNQIKLTSGAANGTQAYYAAESGIEKGLFAIRVMRDDPDFYLDKASEQAKSAIPIIQSYDGNNFVNKASFDISQASAITPKIVDQEIKENEYVQIDYYDVDDPLSASTSEVAYITVQNSGNNPASWAEVSWTAWDSIGALLNSTSAKRVIGPSDLSRVNGWTIPALDVFPGDPVGYRVRIKALKAIPTPTDTEPGDLSSVTVTPYDINGDEVFDLPSQVEIKSIGERGGFKQSLVALVPWKLPLFGLYDYVLFSESDIYKDIILNAPTYSSGTQEATLGMAETASCDITTACVDCITDENWEGWCPVDTNNVSCFGEESVAGVNAYEGTCKIYPQTYEGTTDGGSDWQYYGFVLPISDTIPEGDEYYVSLRLGYMCDDGPDGITTNCDGRDIAVEINGQSAVVPDLIGGLANQSQEWAGTEFRTCTIPDSYSLGSPSLPVDDFSRTIQITNHPYGAIGDIPPAYKGSGWREGTYDHVLIDWYQLSTYKMFDDCY